MKQNVGWAVVVHTGVDEMDPRRVLDSLWSSLARCDLREMEHWVMFVASVQRMMLLEDLSPFFAP